MGSEWEVTPTNLLDVRLSLIFLRFWGCWPSMDWTTLQRTLYRCQTTFSLGTLLLFLLSEVLALCDRGNSLETHIGNACLLMTLGVGMIKVLVLEANRIPMVKLISRLSSMHVHHGSAVSERVEILRGAALKANLVTGVYYILCFMSCTVWFLYPAIYVALTEDPCSLTHTQSELWSSVSLSANNNSTNETNRALTNRRTESKKKLLPMESNLEGIFRINSMSRNLNSSSEISEWNFTNNEENFVGRETRSSTNQQLLPEICVPPHVFPADAWFPFDTTGDPAYKIAYVFQMLSIHIGCMYSACPDTMYATLFIYIAAQLNILNISVKNVRKMTGEENSPGRISVPLLNADWTERLGNRKFTIRPSDDVERRTEEALVACIKHHQDIISSVSELQSLISSSLLLQVVTSMCVICLTLFSAAVGAQDLATVLKFTIYLLAMFAELFLICWFADDIIWESFEVYHSAFGCEWPDGSRAFKQKVLMMILRAQKPLVITAGKFYVMSRSTYLQIMQASYSVFTVLRNVKDS